MANTLLAVDASVPALLRHREEFSTVGIATCRAYTMYEAISRLIRDEEHLCVVVNEDSIPDFMTMLPIMGDVAKMPLYITSHTHTKAKEIKAMQAGADAYKAFGETAKEDVDCCLEHLKLPAKWAQRVAIIPPVLGGGDIILSKTRRLVYGKSREIRLTTKEFDILMLLMDSQGVILTYDQIIENVWRKGADNPSANALCIQINHLRKKLALASPDCEHMIVNVPNVGYCFVAMSK